MAAPVRAAVAFGMLGFAIAYSVVPTAQILAGFHSDGFQVVQNVTFNSSRGFVAQSLNTTLLSTGQHKLAYYVEGSAYTMGYLSGLMAEPAAGA